VGNEEYARANRSFGLTTLRNRHVVDIGGEQIHFKFRGKHGKMFDTSFADRRVATVLRKVEGLPGQHLLQFVDDAGEPHRIGSDDVNAYIREATGGDFSAKDFRTWAATVLAALALLESGETDETQKGQKGAIRRAIERVATRLGNTPTVCRQSYVHPEIIEGYLDGTLAKILANKVDEAATQEEGLSKAEQAVLRFLRKRIALRAEEAKKTETLSAALKNSLAA
jgi:DNA topoisomerase-1